MPRPARLNLPGIPQHVTQRGNNRQACFFSTDDYRRYLDLHTCWLQLGAHDEDRRVAYSGFFREALDPHLIRDIRYSIDKGLPTGNDRFSWEIEQVLVVKLGNGRRGRPRKSPD
jgi:hypothetical protein